MFFYIILLAIVQGITEFLPVSSSGHLVVLQSVLPLALPDPLAFDVMLHWGTLLSVVVYFWSDIVRVVRGLFQGGEQSRMGWYISLASIPAVAFGWFALPVLGDALVRSPQVVAAMLVLGALLFFAVERAHVRNTSPRTLETFTLKDAVLIGFAQAAALIPGVSRSGITIVAGLSRGLHREAAARFSFLLSLPVVFGAGLKKGTDVGLSVLFSADGLIYVLGFVVAAVVGYGAVRFLMRYVVSHSLVVFGWYRLALTALILFFAF